MRYLKRMIDIVLGCYLLLLAAMTLPALLGFQIFTVISQSMAPSIRAGAAVFVGEERFEDIQEGDIITYMLGENRTIVTHRVIEKKEASQMFVTQGDANKQTDPEVAYQSVIGVVKLSVPYLGYGTMLLGKTGERLLLAGVLLWLLLMQGIVANILEIRQKGVTIL